MTRNIDTNIFMQQTPAPVNGPLVENISAETVNEIQQQIPIQSVPQEHTNIENNKTNINPETGLQDVINIKNLRQIFNEGKDNEYRLFDNFSLDIPDFPNEGQLISIMGGSGCGKSCLLRAIAGLTTIPEGEITIYGKSIKEYGNIPMVFQTYSNYEWMTVLDNVKLPMKLRGIKDEEAEQRAKELLDIVGLTDHINKYAKAGALSGGQLQRVSIARSLACDSQIILFDEATGALDINMKREIQNIILKIFNESKYDPTILNVTHSVEEAVYLSNRIVILKPKPCTVYQTIDVKFPGEDTRKRGPWVLETPEFAEYTKIVTKYLDDVCK